MVELIHISFNFIKDVFKIFLSTEFTLFSFIKITPHFSLKVNGLKYRNIIIIFKSSIGIIYYINTNFFKISNLVTKVLQH